MLCTVKKYDGAREHSLLTIVRTYYNYYYYYCYYYYY